MFDLFRSQGHLLFSKWTISQRTVSVRAEARFRSMFLAFSNPLFADVSAKGTAKVLLRIDLHKQM